MAEEINIHELLAQSTFLISGSNGIPGQNSSGTIFLVERPVENTKYSAVMLVTANHVLNSIKSDHATIIFRKRDSQGNWIEIPKSLNIRSGGIPLWTSHPEADIAALPLLENVLKMDLPIIKKMIEAKDISRLPYSGLSDDAFLQKAGINIGSELSCLGYPHNIGSPGGGRFPVLRGGRLASYPILPSKQIKNFYFDFTVFPGNSGGPVYVREKYAKIGGGDGVMLREGVYQGLVGLVTQKQFASNSPGIPIDLVLGVVMPSTLIKDTVDLTPLKSK